MLHKPFHSTSFRQPDRSIIHEKIENCSSLNGKASYEIQRVSLLNHNHILLKYIL